LSETHKGNSANARGMLRVIAYFFLSLSVFVGMVYMVVIILPPAGLPP
jgi:hypothetical protein